MICPELEGSVDCHAIEIPEKPNPNPTDGKLRLFEESGPSTVISDIIEADTPVGPLHSMRVASRRRTAVRPSLHLDPFNTHLMKDSAKRY